MIVEYYDQHGHTVVAKDITRIERSGNYYILEDKNSNITIGTCDLLSVREVH